MHTRIEPSILYFGTPVVLISTLDPDGRVNVAPMSSVWWLGWGAMLGLDSASQTTANLRRTGECVLNLAGEENATQVDALALLTGRSRVPLHKRALGYRTCRQKLEVAGLTTTASDVVDTPRLVELPIQLEARVAALRPFGRDDPRMAVSATSVELVVEAVHVDEGLRVEGHPHRVDPDRCVP